MRIQIHGKQMNIGNALRVHVEEKLLSIVEKYAERTIEASVTFSRDAHEFCCECSAHLSTGLTAHSKSRATEVYASFDQAVERLEKQLRRYKRRLKDHHKRQAEPVETFAAPSYVLASSVEEPADLQPIVIAEMTTPIRSLSVGEAVMQMEFADSSFLVFKNEAHGGFNVVFRREDGNVGWIDPKNLDAV